MKLGAAVKKETGHIAVGVLIGDAIMLAAFTVLQRMDLTVLLGALLGSAGAIGNFVLMCLDAQKAMEDPERVKLRMQLSYSRRMLGMLAIMAVGFAVSWFHPVAVVLPFLMPSATIKLMQLLGMYKPQKKGADN